MKFWEQVFWYSFVWVMMLFFSVLFMGCFASQPETKIVTQIKRVSCPPTLPMSENGCPVLSPETPKSLASLSKIYNVVWEAYDDCQEVVKLWEASFQDCQDSLATKSNKH